MCEGATDFIIPSKEEGKIKLISSAVLSTDWSLMNRSMYLHNIWDIWGKKPSDCQSDFAHWATI